MSHRYSHLRNLRDLDEEVLRLKLKKEFIRAEFSQNFQYAKKNLLSGRYLWSALLGLFNSDTKGRHESDRFDNVSSYVTLLSNLLNFMNKARK